MAALDATCLRFARVSPPPSPPPAVDHSKQHMPGKAPRIVQISRLGQVAEYILGHFLLLNQLVHKSWKYSEVFFATFENFLQVNGETPGCRNT